MKKLIYQTASAAIAIAVSVSLSFAQSTAFTYQGTLENNGSPANGLYDMQFKLFDQAEGGNQAGTTVSIAEVQVVNGSFSVSLDFGDQFGAGDTRFLEIAVRPNVPPAVQEELGSFTVLSPRQRIRSVPFAVRSAVATFAETADSADFAANALQLGGVAADQYVVTTDPRLTDARAPTSGSGDYIQNSTTLQASSNFNISGTGMANILDATTQLNLDGNRFVSGSGASGTFVGIGAGSLNPLGANNTFVGRSAGFATTTGSENTFVGGSAGKSNTSGISNSYFGSGAGQFNTEGSSNSFFGYLTGTSNTTGFQNSFFGTSSGENNTTGTRNSYFGDGSGAQGVSGAFNAFFGFVSGFSNTASFNSFFGAGAGTNNSGGTRNSYFGMNSGYEGISGSDNAFFGFGSGQKNTESYNSFFGSQAGNNNQNGTRNAFFGAQAGINNTSGTNNTYFGFQSGAGGTMGSYNSYFGSGTGISTTGVGNTFIGRLSGNSNTSGSANTLLGVFTDTGLDDLTNATAIGAWASVTQSDSLVLGSILGVNGASASVNVGIGITAPRNKLEVNGGILVTGPRTSFTGNGMVLSSEADYDLVQSFNNRPLILNGVGNRVGINMTSPTEPLEIGTNNSSIIFGGGGCPSGSVLIGLNGPFNACTDYSVRGDGSNLFINRPAGGEILFREANGSSTVRINSGGTLQLSTLGAAGSTSLCRNASNQVSTCSSSIRYKYNVENFSSGADILRRLRPVSFNWKDSGMLDLGLVAEEVAEIEPLLVTYNANGSVEGVKYDRIGVVLVNVVKEQQKIIESLRDEVKRQKEKGKKREIEQHTMRTEIAELKALVCASNPGAAACQ